MATGDLTILPDSTQATHASCKADSGRWAGGALVRFCGRQDTHTPPLLPRQCLYKRVGTNPSRGSSCATPLPLLAPGRRTRRQRACHGLLYGTVPTAPLTREGARPNGGTCVVETSRPARTASFGTTAAQAVSGLATCAVTQRGVAVSWAAKTSENPQSDTHGCAHVRSLQAFCSECAVLMHAPGPGMPRMGRAHCRGACMCWRRTGPTPQRSWMSATVSLGRDRPARPRKLWHVRSQPHSPPSRRLPHLLRSHTESTGTSRTHAHACGGLTLAGHAYVLALQILAEPAPAAWTSQ